MDLTCDLLTNKKKIIKQKNINNTNKKLKNEDDLYNFIKDEILKNDKIESGPFIKLSDLQLLEIIKISIQEYKLFNQNLNKNYNKLNTINNNKKKKINIDYENTTKNIKIITKK